MLHTWRSFVTAALIFAGSASGAAVAQEATPDPASLFADLGLPELTITQTAETMQIDQQEIPAGRYLVRFVNETENPEASGGFVLLPDGKNLDDLSAADELAAGTPVDPMAAPPPDEDWLYETYIIAGGSALGPMSVVDLLPGNYGVWADDPVSPIAAASLTVTGDAATPEAASEPAASLTITEVGEGGQGWGFVTEGELSAGSQVVKVVNDSEQPHFIIMFQYPEPITLEQFTAAMMMDPSSGATPPADMIDFSRMQTAGWVGAQSGGTTQWTTVTLDPGQVIMVCFVPDPEAGGVPHAMEGMISVLDVAGS